MDITNYVLSHRERALLIGDHGAYRAQLSRNLRTMRRQLGRATPKNAQFASKPIEADDIGKNPAYAHVLLLSAERAWAHAVHMKTSHVEDSAAQKIPGSRRSHIVSRLIKATKQARILLNALEHPDAKASSTDWLEAKAYTAYLHGLAELEKNASSPKTADKNAQRQKWQACLENLSVARIIYTSFYKRTKKEYFKDVVSTSIDPSMRFASYQSQIPRTVPVTAVARKYFPEEDSKLLKALKEVDVNALEDADAQTGGDTALPTTITWRSRKANLGDASISQALVDVAKAEEILHQQASADLSKSTSVARAAAYDDVLIASQDAVDATRHAIDEHEKEKIPESDPRMQDLRVTSLAVNYDMIGWRVGRNRVLIGPKDGLELEALPQKPLRSKNSKQIVTKPEGRGRKLARLRERSVLYDAILQSIDSIKDLRGAARDEKFIAELEAKRAYFQALKVLNIAYSHELLGNYINTLALVVRAESLASSALKGISSSKQPESGSPLRLDVSDTSATTLQAYLATLTHHYNGIVDLQQAEQQGKSGPAADGKDSKISRVPIINRLHEYPVGGVDLTNLVTYPPKLEPVPVKPLFLDLAFNYIEYPGQGSAKPAPAARATTAKSGAAAANDDGEELKREAEQGKQKKGWFGFGR